MKLDVQGDLAKDCLIRGLRAHISFLQDCLLDPSAQERALAAAPRRVEALEAELQGWQRRCQELEAAEEKRSIGDASTSVGVQSARSMVSEQVGR